MFSLPVQTRLNSGNRARDNMGANPLQRLPMLYPRHVVASNISAPHTPFPRHSVAAMNEAMYDYSAEQIHNIYRGEQQETLVYPRLAGRTVAPFPSTLQASGSLLGSVSTDILLREAANKRPRLSRDSFNRFVAPSFMQPLPFNSRTSMDYEKLSAIGFGGMLNQTVLPNGSGYFPDHIYAPQLLASRTNLTSVNLSVGTKDLKPFLPTTDEDLSVKAPGIEPDPQTCVQPNPGQFVFPADAPSSESSTDHRPSSVSHSIPSDATSTGISTNLKQIPMTQPGNEKVSHRMVVFKHEPRKRKSQPLTISSVSSLVSTKLDATVKQESVDSAQTTVPNTSSNSDAIQSTRLSDSPPSTDIPTSTLISSDSSISVVPTREQITPNVNVPLSRPQSVMIRFTGANNGNVNSSLSTLLGNPKRPVLPGPAQRPTQPVMDPSQSPVIPLLQVPFNERNESLQPPNMLLSTKHRSHSPTFKSTTGCTESVYRPVAFGATSTTSIPIRGPTIIPPSVDDVLWGRKFFGKSNPQQLIYTLVYLYARTFGLWTGEQLGRLRFGPRSQFTFVLLKPGETTKPIELLPPSSSYPFTAIDSNLFRADSKPLLLLPRLRLLYMHEGKETEPSGKSDANQNQGETHGAKGSLKSESPQRLITKRYLIDHFDANNHERCVLCYHAFYLSKRPSVGSDPERDQYFLAWQTNPTSDHWFRTYPIEARCLSLIIQTIRTALDCAELAQCRSIPAPISTQQFFSQIPHGNGMVEPAGPLNLVIREHTTTELPLVKNSKSHPTCLDYWPELTERARQSPWQCSDCKSCHVCHGKEYNTELLVCDACDKGFHSECHVPKLEEPVDRSLPWVCADCQKEGYSVAIGTLPGAVDAAFSTFSTTTTTTTTTTSSITTATTATTEDRTSAEHETTCQQNSAPSIEVVGSPEKPNTSETAFKPSKHLVVDSNPTVANSTGSEQSTLSVTPDRHRTRTSRSNSTTPASLTPTQNKSTELSTNDSDSSQLDEVPGKSSTSSASVVVLEEKTSTICQAHTSLVQTSQGANSSHVSHKPKSLSGSSPSESHASSSVDRSPEKTSAVSGSCRPPTIAVDNTPRSSPPLEQTKSSASTDRGVHRSSESAPTVDELPNHSGSTTYTARPDDIRAWSVDHVRDWLLEEGFPREAEAFSQQEIDGACLLLMKRMDVLTELGIKLGPAVKIYERIKRLQSRCTSPTILCT